MIDGLDEHRRPVLIEVPEHLGVRLEAAGADAEHQSALQEIVEHGDLACHLGGVVVGQVDRASAEDDALRAIDEACQKDRGGRDVLRQVRRVLADEGLLEAQLIGSRDDLPVFLQGFRVIPRRRMDRHGEERIVHVVFLFTVDADGSRFVAKL
jgi:hypothetical protein